LELTVLRQWLSIVAGIAFLLALTGCSPRSLTRQQAVSSALGTGAKLSDVDMRPLSGNAPAASWSVRTETTPTAQAVMRLLASMSDQYSGQNRDLTLRVFLPKVVAGGGKLLDLRWNPTTRTDRLSGSPPFVIPATSILLGTGDYGGSIIRYRRVDEGVPLSSSATTNAVRNAANGSGSLLQVFRERAGIR